MFFITELKAEDYLPDKKLLNEILGRSDAKYFTSGTIHMGELSYRRQ